MPGPKYVKEFPFEKTSKTRVREHTRELPYRGDAGTSLTTAISDMANNESGIAGKKFRPGFKDGGKVDKYINNDKLNPPRQPKPFPVETREAKHGGKVNPFAKKAKGDHAETSEKKSDAKQDKAMLARHNRLMHPGQKSKLAKGGSPFVREPRKAPEVGAVTMASAMRPRLGKGNYGAFGKKPLIGG